MPNLHAWTLDDPLRWVQPEKAKDDPDPKALSCFMVLLRADTGGMLLLIWDNASWHVSGRVRRWLRKHNRRLKKEGGVRILAWGLPVKRPGLNAMEPKRRHGKQAISEPQRKRAASEVRDRVGNYYHCEQRPPLIQEPKQPKTQKQVA